jgi:hypothetical protein
LQFAFGCAWKTGPPKYTDIEPKTGIKDYNSDRLYPYLRLVNSNYGVNHGVMGRT